jgi:hypothetical protein
LAEPGRRGGMLAAVPLDPAYCAAATVVWCAEIRGRGRMDNHHVEIADSKQGMPRSEWKLPGGWLSVDLARLVIYN